MSSLTDETRAEAKRLYVPITRNERVSCAAYCSNFQEVIDFLEAYKNKPGAFLFLTGADDYTEPAVTVEWQVELSEEEVLKNVRRRINDINIQKKNAERAKLTKEKRLEVEIKELEKQLARKKKALEK